MILKRLRRSCLASLLGLIALLGNGVALSQLNGNVIWAALNGPPAATQQVADMHGGHAGHGEMHPCHEDKAPPAGHSNRGHADCAMCGPIGALAAIILADTLPTPGLLAASNATVMAVPATQTAKHQPLSYHSRAPPALS